MKKLSTNTLLVWYCDPAARFWKAIWGTCCINPEDDSIPPPPWWSGIDEQWKVDQIEVINIAKYNRGYRYLLTVVDVFSKLAWVQHLKNKTGQVMMDAFQKLLKGGRQLMNLQTDDGKEFYNKTFQALTKWKGIHHFLSSRDTKASVVKRFNQTLKKRLYRYLTVKNTLHFVPILQDLVQGYNPSYHRSIKRAPKQVTQANSPEMWETLYRKEGGWKKSRLKVGHQVRLNKKFCPFKKGYLPGWTEEVFVVRSVQKGKVPTYKVDKWDCTKV